LKADGVLLDIVVKNSADVDETLPILALFKNTGEKGVDAQFRGKITLDDKIIQILESEKNFVPISGTSDFNFYFTPKNAGKYIVSGRVFYSNKKTFELSAIVNVISKKFSLKSLILPLIYAILILGAIFLLYKIKKESKNYQIKLRRLR